MREILFRGKRVDNNDWVYGYVYIDEKAHYILEHDENRYRKHFYDYEVIPETIGQYTGLTDKNGKKIFEGDIIKYIDEETSYTVMFDPTGYWCLDGNGARNSEMLIYDDHYKYIEVIGNIYDKEVQNENN